MTAPDGIGTASGVDVRLHDPTYGLPIVGHGPEFHATGASHWWRFRLKSLNPGDAVDVLLDDGRIVRSTLRGLRVVKMLRRVRIQVWVVGIVGSYADGRIRPADGWWRTHGCVRS